VIGIANVHHYLRARSLFLSDHAAIDGEIDEAFVDAALRSLAQQIVTSIPVCKMCDALPVRRYRAVPTRD